MQAVALGPALNRGSWLTPSDSSLHWHSNDTQYSSQLHGHQEVTFNAAADSLLNSSVIWKSKTVSGCFLAQKSHCKRSLLQSSCNPVLNLNPTSSSKPLHEGNSVQPQARRRASLKALRASANPNPGSTPDESKPPLINGTPANFKAPVPSPRSESLNIETAIDTSSETGSGTGSDTGSERERDIKEVVLQLKTEQKNLRMVSDEPSTRPAWEVGAPFAKGGPADRITLIQRTVRGGQTEDHPGTVVIFGDANRQSVISAGGDIIVWGRLRGEAHAGKFGDRKRVICALDMAPTKLNIADKVAYGPDGKGSHYPEVARLDESGSIQIEPSLFYQSPAGKAGANRSTDGRLPLTKPAWAALLTGAYISVVGAAVVLFPVKLFGLLFNVKTISPGWIRVGGVLAMVFGAYYLGTPLLAQRGMGPEAFYWSTVVGRVFLFAAFCLLVALRLAQPGLLVLGAVNLAGAFAMYQALNAEEKQDRDD